MSKNRSVDRMTKTKEVSRTLIYVYWVLRIFGMFPARFDRKSQKFVQSSVHRAYTFLIILWYIYVYPKLMYLLDGNITEDYMAKFSALVKCYHAFNLLTVTIHIVLQVIERKFIACFNQFHTVLLLNVKESQGQLAFSATQCLLLFLLTAIGNSMTIIPEMKRRELIDFVVMFSTLVPFMSYCLLLMIFMTLAAVLRQNFDWISTMLHEISYELRDEVLTKHQRLGKNERISEKVEKLARKSSEVKDQLKIFNKWTALHMSTFIGGCSLIICSVVSIPNGIGISQNNNPPYSAEWVGD
jgi:7tm Chemosensory receptor